MYDCWHWSIESIQRPRPIYYSHTHTRRFETKSHKVFMNVGTTSIDGIGISKREWKSTNRNWLAFREPAETRRNQCLGKRIDKSTRSVPTAFDSASCRSQSHFWIRVHAYLVQLEWIVPPGQSYLRHSPSSWPRPSSTCLSKGQNDEYATTSIHDVHRWRFMHAKWKTCVSIELSYVYAAQWYIYDRSCLWLSLFHARVDLHVGKEHEIISMVTFMMDE